MNAANNIQWKRIDSDTNGNPRYVCHYSNLLTDNDKEDHTQRYELALKRAKAIGGKKFHNKQYGGGIVFQSHNIRETEKHINELLKSL